MAIPGTVPVTAPVAPTAVGDTYASHIETYGQGGYRAVADNTERDAIPVARRKANMLVYSAFTDTLYKLNSDMVTWDVYNPGGVLPAGIMYKSVYDPNDDGIVNNSEQLGGQTLAQVRDRSLMTGVQPEASITGLTAALATKEPIASIGTNGHAAGPLSGGLIPMAQIPFTSSLYKGLYDASTNTPAIVNGTGTAGWFYIANITGNAYAPVNVTVVNQIVAYDGAIWQVGGVFTGGIASVTTDVGVQTGPAVTIDDTTYIAPSTDRNYVTDDILAGLAGSPTAITALNTAASQADLLAFSSTITAGIMPEQFSDGQTLGTGILRTLTSLGYNNGTAATAWPRVAADPARFGAIDVNTMDIDWISWQEALAAMELEGYNSITTPGNKGYCTYKGLLCPRDQTAVITSKRSYMFIYNFNGSSFYNNTGSSWIQFDKYPVDQADADGLRLVYSYHFLNGTFYGNNSTSETDCFIRLGGTAGSTCTNINGSRCGMVVDFQFCLQPKFYNIGTGDYGKYGIAVRDGLWSGAGPNISQSNNVTINGFHSYNGTGKTPTAAVYCQGNRNIDMIDCGFEGQPGMYYFVFYELMYPPSGVYASTVKNCLRLINCDFESSSVDRAYIRINGSGITLNVDSYNVISVPLPQTCFVENSAVSSPNYITIKNSPTYNWGYTFRQVGVQSPWIVENVLLNDNSDFIAAANWSTDFGGVLPTLYRYTPVLQNMLDGQTLKSIILSGDVVNNNAVANTLQDVTNLRFPVVAGRKYYFKFVIPYYAQTTTTGSRWSINGPTAPVLIYSSKYSLGAASVTTNESLTAYNLPAAANASSTNTLSNVAYIEGFLLASASGYVIARFASELSGSAITAKAGAVVYYQETYI